jgi:hypothetical protein
MILTCYLCIGGGDAKTDARAGQGGAAFLVVIENAVGSDGL